MALKGSRLKDAIVRVFGRKAAVSFLSAALPFFIFSADAYAFPFFSRQVGRDCTYCHSIFPKLNETGRAYRSGGYRFAAEGEWKEVKDWTALPASFEAEIEGAYSRIRSNGVRTESSDLKVEEVELSAGGAMGKSGRISALASVITGQTDTGTDTRVNRAFVQINDLAGERGEGALNLRAGQWDLGLPFLNTSGMVITNQYLAETTLGLLNREQRGVELNGFVQGSKETLPTHRYSVGLTREDVNSSSKLKGYYATYSATFLEVYSIGAIYRGGHEKNGLNDISFNKYGLAGEAEAGPVILTLAYFRVDRTGAPDINNYLAEAFYTPVPRLSFGARFDYAKEKDKKGIKSQSFMARYNILSNAYAQVEYRGLSDKDHLKGANEDEDKVRVFLVAVF